MFIETELYFCISLHYDQPIPKLMIKFEKDYLQNIFDLFFLIKLLVLIEHFVEHY